MKARDPLRLAGARAKIKRAEQHVLDLDSEVASYRARKPYSIVANDKGTTKRFKVSIAEPVPLEFGLFIGDCVHNLRSALDHLVMCAVYWNRGQPTIDTGFPIAGTRKRFEAVLAGKVDGASAGAVDLIRTFEPYNTGDAFLYALHELDVIDKHKVILTTVGLVSNVVALMDDGDGTLTDLGTGLGPRTPEHGSIVFRQSDATYVGSSAEGHYYADVALDIAFAEPEVVKGQAVVPTLAQFCEFVNEIADAFARHILK